MTLIEASEAVKLLYKNSIVSQKEWNKAIERFNINLLEENDLAILEECILNDPNWELHVEGRISLLKKAKFLGVSSRDFLIDYYGYLSAHLDPCKEQKDAENKLINLLSDYT